MRRYSCLIILMLLGHFMESMSSPAAHGGGGQVPTQVFFSEVKVGSRPPSCDHKCGGCRPCRAAQVPATSDEIREGGLVVEYANYEPEGWMCKCASSFYHP
ncbi:hypothetical protein KSP40_PGU022491 [Platanthera guangdongensis]|uniref:Epidermal patterning factor-like protein n=1 Tax=Platanthera guangdongensis TaxID=2320717 RepID=A0ABR2LH95_9ASPA